MTSALVANLYCQQLHFGCTIFLDCLMWPEVLTFLSPTVDILTPSFPMDRTIRDIIFILLYSRVLSGHLDALEKLENIEMLFRVCAHYPFALPKNLSTNR